jgi:hypothetical protein
MSATSTAVHTRLTPRLRAPFADLSYALLFILLTLSLFISACASIVAVLLSGIQRGLGCFFIDYRRTPCCRLHSFVTRYRAC